MAISMGSAVAYLELDTTKFQKGMKTALSDLKVFGSKTATGEQKLKGLSSALKTAGSGLTKGVTLPLSAIGTASVKVASDFESNMSQVAATMGITTESIKAGNKEFEALKSTAKEMGRTTKYTASEAAQGLNILAMAGLNADESIKTIPVVLDLASAGVMSLDQAASYVTATVKGFADSMDNASYYSDLMAKGATLANTDVNMLGTALSSASSTARGYGQTAESTTLSLLRLAEQNVTGEEAATALSRAMADLYTPTEKAAGALEELGIATYDSNGKARDFNDIVDELNSALSGMSDEEANAYKSMIFTTYGFKAFNKMTVSSTEKINDFKNGLKEASGSASQQAQTQLDNLQGSMTLLKSALEGAGIAIGERLIPHIKNMAEWINKAVTWFNNLSDSQLDMIVNIGKIIAIIGPLLLIVSKVIGLIITVKKTVTIVVGIFVKLLGILSSFGAFITGTLLPAIATFVSTIGAPIIIITAIIAAIVLLYNKCEWFRNSINNVIKTVRGYLEQFVEFIKRIPDSVKEFIDSVISFFSELPKKAKEKFDEVIDSAIQWGTDLYNSATQYVIDTIDAIVQFFSDLPYKIGYELGYALGTIIRWGTEVGQWVVETIPKVIESIVTFFSELPDKIWKWLTETYNNIKQWGIDTVKKAKETAQSFIENIEKFFKELPGKVKKFVTDAYNNVKTWATDMITKAKETANKFVNNVVTFIKELPGKIRTYLTDAYKAVVKWGTETVAKAKKAARDIADGIVTKIKEVPGKMLSIGKDIVTGIWNGISGAKDWIKRKVGDFAKGILDGMKAALGIHSPSTKFRDLVGKNIVAGIVEGIKDDKKDITKELDDITDINANIKTSTSLNDIMKMYENIFKTISGSMNESLTSFADTLKETLLNILFGFDTLINDTKYIRYGTENNVPYRTVSGMEERTVKKQNRANNNTGGGDTFIFQTPVQTPYEYARQLKKTKQEILNGFA